MTTDSHLVKACCFHEAGHSAVAYFFRVGLHGYDLTVSDKATGGFQFPSIWSGKTVQALLRTATGQARSAIIRNAECEILRLLGGMLAECRFYRPIKRGCAVRFSEIRYPGSDSYRIRELLRALTGKDDKKYQLRLQDEAWGIISEPRTWNAITCIATRLADRGKVPGRLVEYVFRKFSAPQTITW